MAGDEKMEVDKTAVENPYETDPAIESKIADAVALGTSMSIEAAVEKLLGLERTNRMAAAAPETAAICVAIVRLFRDKKDWKSVGEHVVLLSKRRAQLKAAVTKIVQEAMSYLDDISDESDQLVLLETLRAVTAGKIVSGRQKEMSKALRKLCRSFR
jgi:26S proteasome regulatory subunit N5